MNVKLIIVLTYLTSFVLFLIKNIINEVVILETNRRIKFSELKFGGFLWFIYIWVLIT